MRRVLFIIALVLLGLMLLTGLGLIGLLYTPPGRHLLASLIEPRLGQVLGGEASIGALTGPLPDKIVLEDLEVAGAQGDWIRIDRIEMNWSAFALLKKQIKVEALNIEGVHVLAASPEKQTPQKKKPFVLPPLPDNLPNITVKSLAITNVDVAQDIFGRQLELDASGRLVMHGRNLSLDLNARSEGDTDTINASIDLDPATNHGAVDIIIASSDDGFLSSVANIDGKLSIRAVGDAPLDDFNMQFEAEAGSYGSADLSFSGDLLRPKESAIEAQGDIMLGSKMTDLAKALGDRLRIDIALTRPQDVTRLTVNKFESAAGTLNGALEWDSGKKGVQSFSGDLSADLAARFYPDIQQSIGTNARLTFTLTEKGKQYTINAGLDTPKAALTIEDGKTDLSKFLAGLASLKLKPAETLPSPLKKGVEVQAFADLKTDGVSTLEELHMETPDGLSFDGEARFDAAKNALALGGDAVITPESLKNLTSGISIDEAAHAKLSASGTLPHLSGKIDLDAPAVAASNGAFPPLRATIQFSRTKAGLAADLKGHAKGASGQVKGRFVINGTQMSAQSVSLTGEHFTLDGSASYDTDQQAAKLNISYHGDEGAEPWPGVEASGSLTLTGALNRQSGATDFTLTSKGFAVGGVKAGNLKAHASGPPRRVIIEANGDTLILPAVGSVDTLRLAGVADLGDPISVRLTKLDALASGETIQLTQPATFILKNGVEIHDFKASIGSGSMAADASLAKDRWKAALSLANAPLPRADGYASVNLNLDTDRDMVARGDLSIQPTINKTVASAIKGSFTWDGEQLRFSDNNQRAGQDINITLPLKLMREPSLSVTMAGDLSGNIDYKGRIEAFSPFLPTTLQSLEGDVTAHATIDGTINDPTVDGRVDIANGAYTELASGISLTGIEGTANASTRAGATEIEFDFGAHGVGQSGKTLTLSGQASLGEQERIDAAIKANGARFSAGPVQSATIDGNINLTGPLTSIEAKGALMINELNASLVTPSSGSLVDITVIPVSEEQKAEQQKESTPPPPFVLNIDVSANDRIFVRGRGLESEWQTKLHISGDAREPLITGPVGLLRGYLDFAGRRFTLTKGAVNFDRLSPNNPTLDVSAEYDAADNVTAAIDVSGRAKSPSISLTSTPSLPTNDVMALVLFGKQATDLTATESLQVAAALAQLSGVGPFGGGGGGITGLARRTLGLDLLNVDIGANANESKLEVGKYVAEGLFISATEDVQGKNGSVRLQYDITPSISVETKLQQDGEQTVSANWKHDF